jgi:hypothetical protein
VHQHRSGEVPRDRIDYGSSIGDSSKQQTLLNIVKLRHTDMPIFLEVAQVIAGYQLQSTIGSTFTAGNFNAAVVGPFMATGSATAAGTYTDRATVVYQPLTRVDFLEKADDADSAEFGAVCLAGGLVCRPRHAGHAAFRQRLR